MVISVTKAYKKTYLLKTLYWAYIAYIKSLELANNLNV